MCGCIYTCVYIHIYICIGICIYMYTYTYIYVYRLIDLVGRVFTNDPGDQGSIPGRVIPKTLKIVLDASLLNTQQYKVRIEWSNLGKGVAPSSTLRCSSY